MKYFTREESRNLCPLVHLDESEHKGLYWNTEIENGDLWWFLQFWDCDYAWNDSNSWNGKCTLACWPDNWQELMIISNYWNTVR